MSGEYQDIGVRVVIQGLGAYISGMNDMQKATDKTSSSLDGLAKASKVPDGAMKDLMGTVQKVTGAISIGLIGAFTGAVIAASNEEKSIARLENTLQNVGVAYDDVKGQIEAVTEAILRKTGIADEVQYDVLNRLVLATGDYGIALQALPTALDLAATTGMDATSAAVLLGKAMNGSADALQRYGIEVPEGASALEVLATVQNKVKDAAEKTATPMDKLKGQMGELADKIGTIVLPAFNAIVDHITPIVDWIGKWMDKNPVLSQMLVGVAIAAGTLAGALFILSSMYLSATIRMMAHIIAMIATKPLLIWHTIQTGLAAIAAGGYAFAAGVAAIATWAWNGALAVMDILLSPVVIIILAIVAVIGVLIAIIILVVKHWDDISAAAKKAWDFICDTVKKAVEFIKKHWEYFVGALAGPLGVAVVAIVKHWDKIREGIKKAVDFVHDLWDKFTGFVTGFPDRIRAAFDRVKDIIGNAVKAGINVAIRAINGLINGLNSIRDKLNAIVSKIGWTLPSIPNIPELQYGGYASGAAWVGERGRELVVLPPQSQVVPSNVVNNYITANYTNPQQPQSLAMDFEAIRMMSRV